MIWRRVSDMWCLKYWEVGESDWDGNWFLLTFLLEP